MAVNWPIHISRKFDWGSGVSYTPRFEQNQFGDGYKEIYVMGINPLEVEMSINYENLSPSDFGILLTFLKTYSDGTVVTIPLYPEDPTGSTTDKFIITDFSYTRDYLANVSIKVKKWNGASA